MKKWVVSALFLVSAVTSNSFAESNLRTYKSYPELKKFIEEMEISASGGGSLSFFSYKDVSVRKNRSKITCDTKAFDSEEVVNNFSQLADDMFEGGDPELSAQEFQDLKQRALPQFRDLIGRGPFQVCYYSVSGYMTSGQVHLTMGSDYAFRTEVGSED